MSAVALPLPRLGSRVEPDVRRAGIRPGSRAELHVERTDIMFRNVAPNRVAIEITVTNRGGRRSEPTVAILQAAPLGAFVPWRPLAVLDVPGLDPDESAALRTEAVPDRPRPLGSPDRIPPRRLLTALGADDANDAREPPARRTRRQDARVLLGEVPSRWETADGLGRLPADINELLGRTNPHWAGNVNVFLGNRAVERHGALAMRIYPGRLNLADFVVGTRPDSYRFHLEGNGADWAAALYDASLMASFSRRPPQSAAVPPGEWLPLSGMGILFLALCPPRDAGRGTVEVHVEQQSTGQTAVVEFDLDARARGPGCFVVD